MTKNIKESSYAIKSIFAEDDKEQYKNVMSYQKALDSKNPDIEA